MGRAAASLHRRHRRRVSGSAGATGLWPRLDVGSSRILVVDNYDSFVYNLVQYLAQLGAECTVLRNDEVDLDEVTSFDGVLLSPGPGIPEDA
jgi:carbamoylphosphate synthase small subunit